MYKKRSVFIFIAVTFLILVNISCSLFNQKQSSYDGDPITGSKEDIQKLEKDLQKAIATLQSGGSVELVITEAQLTSVVATEMSSLASDTVTDLQIRLMNGHMEVSGAIEQSGLSLPMKILINIISDGNGNPQVNIIDASVGPLRLPLDTLDQFTNQLEQAVVSQLSNEDTGLFIESIVVANGYITIIGYPR